MCRRAAVTFERAERDLRSSWSRPSTLTGPLEIEFTGRRKTVAKQNHHDHPSMPGGGGLQSEWFPLQRHLGWQSMPDCRWPLAVIGTSCRPTVPGDQRTAARSWARSIVR